MSFLNLHEVNNICKRLERAISRKLRELDEEEILSISKMVLPSNHQEVIKLDKLLSNARYAKHRT